MDSHARAARMTTYYRFDRFELRPARRQLLADGVEIDVGGRAFDLLVALVERRDRVVTRDELYSLVWPSVSVELNNLHVQVWRLRNRLGDQSIRTIARQGYQFVADVEAIVPPAATSRVPAWFAPVQSGASADARGSGPASAEAAAESSAAGSSTAESSTETSTSADPSPADALSHRFDVALRRHRLVAFVHDDDRQRRSLLESALAALPPARRRGTLRYDVAELARRGPQDDAGLDPAGVPVDVPQMIRAASRALLREQLLVLHDAHLAPALVAAVVDAVLRESDRTRVILDARAPLGLQDEHALSARAPDPTPHDAPREDLADPDPRRPLRWRPRGTLA